MSPNKDITSWMRRNLKIKIVPGPFSAITFQLCIQDEVISEQEIELFASNGLRVSMDNMKLNIDDDV